LFAAGNIGQYSADGTISSPATCKNCLSVGASQTTNINFLNAIDKVDFLELFNLLNLNSTDSCCAFTHPDLQYHQRVRDACCPSIMRSLYSDKQKFNEMNMAFFSSRGTTMDGAWKPDLVGPGFQVQSAHSDGRTDTFQCGLEQPFGGNSAAVLTMRGTSMATPVVAGSAALVRQYFRQGFYPTGQKTGSNAIANPSAALMRAAMIQSASKLGGFIDLSGNGLFKDMSAEQYPNVYSGFGIVTLKNVLKFATSPFDLFVQDRVTLTNGATKNYCFTSSTNGPSNTGYFKVTVAWTDPPGEVSASKVLVNNLDLTVFSGIVAYRGNGVVDSVNNVEQVQLDGLPEKTKLVVSVRGVDVPVSPQNFSLVATGNFMVDSSSACSPPTLNSNTISFVVNILAAIGFGFLVVSLLAGVVIFWIFAVKRKTQEVAATIPPQPLLPEGARYYQ